MTTTITKQLAADELMEQVEVIYEALYRMKQALREIAPRALDRAEAYWMAHIDEALENRGGYMGGSMISFQDTIDELLDEQSAEWK